MRLIDADAFMETIRNHDYILTSAINTKDRGMYTIGIQQAIDAAPTIEAEPVRHGRWTPKENIIRCPYARNYYCSECRCDPIETGIFCNNCGAKMDLEVE